MKTVTRYKCDYCGELFSSENMCLEHEDRHVRVDKANEMLKNGCTLKEIQDECNIWYELPDYLKDVTKDNCFKISYWQCCDKPAYHIICIGLDGRVNVRGCGSWNGYYGNYVSINSHDLKNPRPKEELFVDPRYEKRLQEGWQI